jgi:hypothetical protein
MPPRKKIIDIEVSDKPAKKEKKSKKHQVVAVITPDGIQGSFQSETRRSLIGHLPIHSNEIQFHEQHLTYDPRPPCQPEAFNAGEIDPFSTEATYENMTPLINIEKKEEPMATKKEVEKPVERKDYNNDKLLVEYSNSSKTHILPSETTVACFWCCENFKGRPCIIPSQLVDNIWQVYGNFCSPQCSMAYLIVENLDTHTRWERIALLNRLYGNHIKGRIYPAPPRECLERFGGTISSQEFHKICDAGRIRIDIHMPPMVSILASIDTKPIDFYETPLCTIYTASNQTSTLLQTPTEVKGLKLRRTKPLKDKESTLDSCLQIAMKS